MKKIILFAICFKLMICPFQAAIPSGFTIFSWFNQILTDLNVANTKMEMFYDEWASLPPAIKTAIKNRVKNKIDEAITRLTDLKADIDAL